MSLYRLTAFPKTEFGGNKAGVYLNADQLSEKEMQQIAKDVNYSETAFVMKSDVADFRVRFFTPVAEVDLCGHATIAAFNLLKQKGIIKEGFYKQETKAGILEIAVKPNAVFMEQPAPIFGEILEPKDISSAFRNKGYIHPNLPIQICSTGIREIFLPVKDVETLNSLEMDREEMIELSIKHNVIGVHAFALSEDCDAYGRNFAPYLGIDEESATGTSNGALSCYLNKYVSSKYKFILRQGYSMNLPSEIIGKLETEKDVIKKVWVGGTAKIIEE